MQRTFWIKILTKPSSSELLIFLRPIKNASHVFKGHFASKFHPTFVLSIYLRLGYRSSKIDKFISYTFISSGSRRASVILNDVWGNFEMSLSYIFFHRNSPRVEPAHENRFQLNSTLPVDHWLNPSHLQVLLATKLSPEDNPLPARWWIAQASANRELSCLGI